MIVYCAFCGRKFKTFASKLKDGRGKFCSKECFEKANPKWVRHEPNLVKCKECKRVFQAYPSRHRLFCSKTCANRYHMRERSKKHTVEVKCDCCGKCFTKIVSQVLPHSFCSLKCQNIWRARRMYGKKNFNWKGGISKEQRNGLLIYYWRKTVLERDNFTCQECGQQGESLDVHHIKSWRKYPKLRFDINNGMTLCPACHARVHSRKLYSPEETTRIIQVYKKYRCKGYSNKLSNELNRPKQSIFWKVHQLKEKGIIEIC